MAKLDVLAGDNTSPTLESVERTKRGSITLVFVNDGVAHSITLQEGQSLCVGRQRPTDVVLAHPTVSRTHARFFMRSGVPFVEDIGSRNGVRINGRAVQCAALSEGDRVLIGAVEIFAAETGATSLWESRERTASAFVTRLADELERARCVHQPVWLCALYWVDTAPARDHVMHLAEVLRPIDRFCYPMPHVMVALLLERNHAGARGTLDALQRRVRGALPGALLSAPPADCDAAALVEQVVALARQPPAQRDLMREPSAVRSDEREPLVLGAATRPLFELATRISRADLPVLVLGETGAGKEITARVYHQHSQRAHGPFCEVNCAAIAPTLVESILFGYEKGAFTGADRRSSGLFEQANGGTLFLDEVGELSHAAQAALLRVLENKRIRRVGGTSELPVDVRIIAATNRDLRDLVARGEFREDLLYRLAALTVRVPPLRERRDEIEALAQQFLMAAATRWKAPARGFSGPALQALLGYSWPGNVRELRNAIEHAAAVCVGETVQLEDLPEQLGEVVQAKEVEKQAVASLPDAMERLEVGLIRDALARAGGNRAQAARLLGVPRRTLGSKMRSYGLE